MNNFRIEKRSQENLLGSHTGEWCVFEIGSYDFYGLDYSDTAVILLNVDGRFITGEKYANCILITDIRESACKTIEEAMERADKIK